MSINHTPLTEDLSKYLDTYFSSEDSFLLNLREEAVSKGFPNIHIAPSQGLVLQFLLKSIKAKYVLELGTLAGYSAITMARALPKDGKLITVESEFEHAVFAKMKFIEAGLNDIIEIQNSDAKEFLKEFVPEFEFDFVFVDADKPNYKHYLDLITPLLRIGGIFVADNAFAFGYLTTNTVERNPNDIKSIQGFNHYFRNHPQYFTSIIPIGDGMIAGVKIA